MRRFLARAPLILGVLLGVSTAWAVDTPPSDALPDLAPVRALIYSGEYQKAADDLIELSKTVLHADVFNLLGFSLRNLGRYEEADRWYREALYFDPTHRPALEYQGELFLKTGRLDRAKENIVTLEIFCPKGCAELDQLRRAYEQATAGKPAQ